MNNEHEYLEPLQLSLEKKYDLNVIKDITVTDSFLSLPEHIRGCQEQSYNEYATEKYEKDLLNKCQCLPFQFRLSEEVNFRQENGGSPYLTIISERISDGNL